jgi:hypothetical protein
MAIKAVYKGVKKLVTGPGGIGCPCCNPYGVCPNKMKVPSRRLTRRVKKQEFRKEVSLLEREE